MIKNLKFKIKNFPSSSEDCGRGASRDAIIWKDCSTLSQEGVSFCRNTKGETAKSLLGCKAVSSSLLAKSWRCRLSALVTRRLDKWLLSTESGLSIGLIHFGFKENCHREHFCTRKCVAIQNRATPWIASSASWRTRKDMIDFCNFVGSPC